MQFSKIFLIIFFLVISNYGYAQDSIPVSFDIKLALSRDYWGNVIYGGEYVHAHFRFSSDFPIILVFDYDNILNKDSTYCQSYKTINRLFMEDTISPAYLYIENENGNFISPKEISILYAGGVYVKFPDVENNFDIVPIGIHDFKFFDYPLAIPLKGLKNMCNTNKKIRFHYFYKPIEKYKQFNSTPLYLISNWYNIDDIK